MKRARDVREQLEGLMQRVEIEIVSNPTETKNIRKVRAQAFAHLLQFMENLSVDLIYGLL
jgi:pre-mRNA-splicing factor ATP-dependent RNA helicase DHX16